MRVLVVEDEARIADFVGRGLRAEGWGVDIVGDGESALEAMERDGYDVVVLDLMLPGLSGLDVCRQLRQRKQTVPILMLTALGNVEERIAGLRSGADDYLPKPFDFDELVARIEALHRRGAQGSGAGDGDRLSLAGVTLIRSAMTATVDGAPVDLSKREWELLLFLMQNQGKAVSRERILNAVWNTQEDPLTNIVDVYMARLRRKIAPYGDLISTVRGVGYRCGAPVTI